MSYVNTDEVETEDLVDRFINPNPNIISRAGYKIVQLKPYEKPYGDIRVLRRAVNDNLWITSDLHITTDIERTRFVLNMINKEIADTDNLLILGDLQHKKKGDFKHTKDFVSALNTKNVFLLLGNHDMLPMNYYSEMGFLYVGDKVSINYNGQRILFSHAPEPVGKDVINIHGHLHGSNDYWYFSYARHFDAWIPWTKEYICYHKTNGVSPEYPAIQQLGDLLKFYTPTIERGVQ